jgi:hypothetical protein
MQGANFRKSEDSPAFAAMAAAYSLKPELEKQPYLAVDS